MRVSHSFLLLAAIVLTPLAITPLAHADEVAMPAASAHDGAIHTHAEIDSHTATVSSVWTSSELEPAVFEIIVNGRPAGDSVVLLRAEDVLMPLADLRKAGLLSIEAQTESHDGVDYVSLHSVAPYTVDAGMLQIIIDAPASVLGASTIDLSPKAPKEMQYVSAPGVFLNYAPRLIDGARLEGFGELGLTVGGALAITSLSHDPDYGGVRLMSQLVLDDRTKLQRKTLGDNYTRSGPLGGVALLGGMSFASSFELDPYTVKIPSVGFTGSLTTPGTLDVYVNDVFVRRVPVSPGEFEVKNLTPVTGQGSVRYVLRDAYGHEQNVTTQHYVPSGVLAEGLTEYAYNLGLVRQDFGTHSFSYGAPAFVAMHRHGFTNALTGGGRVELSEHLASAGVDVAVAPGFGEIDLAVGGSIDHRHTNRKGVAALASYGYSNGTVSTNTALTAVSSHYATLSLMSADDRDLVEWSSGSSFAFSSAFSLATRLAYALRRDSEPLARAQTALQSRVLPGLSLRLVHTASYSSIRLWEQSATVMLSLLLPEHHSVSASHSQSAQGPNSTLRLTRSVPGRTGVGYDVSGTGSPDQVLLHGSAQARSNHGRLSASATHSQGRPHTLLEGAVGVALVPGTGLFVSQPIEQSFGVIQVPGVKGVRGYLNNQEVGHTNSEGDLFVPGLLPYYANRLRIENSDLPVDVQATDDELMIAPSYRGAAVVRFEAHRVSLLRGNIQLRLEDGSLVPARYGDVVVLARDQTFSSPLGEAGEFEFDGVSPGVWQAEVVSQTGRCTATLRVPDESTFVHDLGVLLCTAESPERAQ